MMGNYGSSGQSNGYPNIQPQFIPNQIYSQYQQYQSSHQYPNYQIQRHGYSFGNGPYY